MRKLKLQVQISLDGYVAGPNGEMDWMTFNWDKKLIDHTAELTDSMDTIVMGRKLAEGFIPHWTNVLNNPKAAPSEEDAKAARTFVETPKVVFSNTLTECGWDYTTLAKNSLKDEVNRLKQQDGKDIIAYGGANFASNLIKEDLVDEYHLYVNPTAIGKGMPLFTDKKTLKLSKTLTCDCGIVVFVYHK